MGLLDRYGTGGADEVVQGSAPKAESAERIRPVIEDRYSDVKGRIHALIIEQQLGSENADISDDGMRKLIDEYVERPDFNIPRVDREVVKKELFDDIMTDDTSNYGDKVVIPTEFALKDLHDWATYSGYCYFHQITEVGTWVFNEDENAYEKVGD